MTILFALSYKRTTLVIRSPIKFYIVLCKCCWLCGTLCLAGQLIYTPISIECHVRAALLIHHLERLMGNSTGVTLETQGPRPHVTILFSDWCRGTGMEICYIHLTPFPDDSSSLMSVGEVFGWIVSL